MRKQLVSSLGLFLVAFTSCAFCAFAGQNDGAKTQPEKPQREFAGQPVTGTITSVGVDRFEIKKMDGTTQTVMVDEHTHYRQGQKDVELEDLKPGDRVFVRGQADSNKQFVAEAVRRVTDDEVQRFQNSGARVFGEIISIDKGQLKVRNPRQGERVVAVNDQTQFMKDGQAITLKDLKVGDRIFALGEEKQGQFLATRVLTGQFRGPRRDNQER